MMRLMSSTLRRAAAAASATALAGTAIVATATPASAACQFPADHTNVQAGTGNWYASPGSTVPEAAESSCNDVNVWSWSNPLIQNQAETFKGQYQSGGTWHDGMAGHVTASEGVGAYRVVISNVVNGTTVRQVTIDDPYHNYESSNYVTLAV